MNRWNFCPESCLMDNFLINPRKQNSILVSASSSLLSFILPLGAVLSHPLGRASPPRSISPPFAVQSSSGQKWLLPQAWQEARAPFCHEARLLPLMATNCTLMVTKRDRAGRMFSSPFFREHPFLITTSFPWRTGRVEAVLFDQGTPARTGIAD